jgi:hypothetical protein
MPTSRTLAKAERAICEEGALLVYPEAGREEPRSLWHVLYPGSAMAWRWDSEADPRVAEVWHVREQLCRRRSVVYSKWYRGRAAFFSPVIFRGLLALQRKAELPLSREAKLLLAALLDDSPQSTKRLRRGAGLGGRAGERAFQQALKALWEAMLIVGTGEEPDGAFPSLSIAATERWFEDLWNETSALIDCAPEPCTSIFPAQSPWQKSLVRMRKR